MAVSHFWHCDFLSATLTIRADADVRYLGSHIQRRLFARRQINQQSTLKRRSAYSEAGTEIKSEKVDGQDVDDDDTRSMIDSSAAVGNAAPVPSKRGWFKFGSK